MGLRLLLSGRPVSHVLVGHYPPSVHKERRGFLVVGQVLFAYDKVNYVGFVYEDATVQNSVIRQKPFIVVAPQSKPAMCVKHIVGRIEKTEAPDNEGVSNFLKKFLGFKK